MTSSAKQSRSFKLGTVWIIPLSSLAIDCVVSATVVLVRFHGPGKLVVAVGVVAVGLRRIAVDQRAQIHRVRGAAHLVLDGEEQLAAVEIDDVLEAVLVLIVLLRDQAALQQALIGAGEI